MSLVAASLPADEYSQHHQAQKTLGNWKLRSIVTLEEMDRVTSYIQGFQVYRSIEKLRSEQRRLANAQAIEL